MLLVVEVPAQVVLPEGPGVPASGARAEHTQQHREPPAPMELTALEAVAVAVVLQMLSGLTAVVQVDLVL
jgi:hypothetical protein